MNRFFFLLPTVTQLNLQLNASVFHVTEGTPTVAVCVDALNSQDIAGRIIPVTIRAISRTAIG